MNQQLVNLNFDTISQFVKTVELLDAENAFDWRFFWKNVDNKYIDYLLGYFSNKIDWKLVSANEKIIIDDNFLDRYEKYLDFQVLSDNKNISLSAKMIFRHREKFKWGCSNKGDGHKYSWVHIGGLSNNPKVPLNVRFINSVKEFIDWRALGMNKALCVFDPAKYGDIDFFPSWELKENVKIINTFWDKWEFEGTYFHDGNHCIHGKSADSIKDNSNIDWDYYEKVKELVDDPNLNEFFCQIN